MTASLHLEKLSNPLSNRGPLLIVVMDGIGIAEPNEANAVHLAKTPNLDKLLGSDLYTELGAHGPFVGAPSEEDMGNSEIGHNAIGAGRVFAQGAKLVNLSIEKGLLYQGDHWKQAIKDSSEGKGIHFLGLLSDGNVHSHIKHLLSMLDRAAKDGAKKMRVHLLLDGRDVPERSALKYIAMVEDKLNELKGSSGGDFQIASGGGRMVITMDRYEADWAMVEKGWKTHVKGEGRMFSSASEAVSTYYEEDDKVNDQYLPPFVVADEEGKPVGPIGDGDHVIFYNFRGDRAIEISKAFEDEEFTYFTREPFPKVHYNGMMEYDGDAHIPKNYLVEPPSIDRTFCEYLLNEGLKLFAVSETQKFGHVTYFWNGNRSGYLREDQETYIEIPSDNISFDQAPRMKVKEITDETIKLLNSGEYQLGRINFPNGDMVGHTGNLEATIESIEALDENIGRLCEAVEKLNGIAIFTADHGNADIMFKEKKGVKSVVTSHTLSPVPFAIYDAAYKGEYKMKSFEKKVGLSSIAGTCLNLLGFENVEDYDPSLIELV